MGNRSNQPVDLVGIEETRSFHAFHTFLRQAKVYAESDLYPDLYRAYERAVGGERRPSSVAGANAILDDLPEYQLYAWLFRNSQQLKYNNPDWGVVAAARRETERLAPKLEAIAAEGIRRGELRLDPALRIPDYFSLVDFHQHPGGVWQHPLDGLAYDLARRTTIAAHSDPNDIYRLIFSYLPPDAATGRVLDWGIGHGDGALTWLESHPESEVHGVDLSAPCLKYAYAKARAHGVKVLLSQQDLEHLDYPDDHFDVVFFCFMLHEIPPAATEPLLREAHRVLKRGGVFLGMELGATADPFQTAVQDANCFLNNEPFMAACAHADYAAIFKRIGYRHVHVGTFGKLQESKPGATTTDGVPRGRHDIFVIRK
ncbi:MAG: class I SAM-dependent methyltransferase [Alphaproteobacteria bacterium]|nr:class I SAM-dependent methyltransferase [Alphaproteobacteria bacterium]